jgi:hypothetical protein
MKTWLISQAGFFNKASTSMIEIKAWFDDWKY